MPNSNDRILSFVFSNWFKKQPESNDHVQPSGHEAALKELFAAGADLRQRRSGAVGKQTVLECCTNAVYKLVEKDTGGFLSVKPHPKLKLFTKT